MTHSSVITLLSVSVILATTAANAQQGLVRKTFKPPVEAEESYKISGRVVNRDGQPVPDCRVQLWEPDGELTLTQKNKSDGEFEFKHGRSGPLVLEVFPPDGHNLAQAIARNLPGDENRKMIVKLHLGVLVTGRVVDGKRNLKDIVLSVQPLDGGLDGKARMHGVGGGITDKKGVFRMYLTPGKKRLTMLNNDYPKLPKQVVRDFDLLNDLHMGAVEFK